MEQRRAALALLAGLTEEELEALRAEGALSREVADAMIENAIGTLEVPLGLGLNFVINGRERVVPMAVEEPSVLAAVSFAAKVAREGGGFAADADEPVMIAQVQVTGFGDAQAAAARVSAAREELLALADGFHPSLVARGGGARDLAVRLLPAPEGEGGEPLFVVHVHVDVRDAMGANLVNTVAEGIAPRVEELTGGRVYLRILSNLADQRLARARCAIPVRALADGELSGDAVCEGIVQASRFAEADPYRAATHNKGIMNGVDAVALATGNDWRALEAGAHAYAARSGQYKPLSRWRREGDALLGELELPLQVGTVGGPIRVHPIPQLALKVLGAEGARDLAEVMAAVGLAQNFAAVRALGSVGIQRGHMARHARSVAATAGARGEQIARVADALVASGAIKVDAAREVLATLARSVA